VTAGRSTPSPGTGKVKIAEPEELNQIAGMRMSSRRSKKKTNLNPRPSPPPAPIIECPSELGPVARQEWDRIVPLLIAADRLTGLDRGPLAIYCTAYAAWLEAETALSNYGIMMKSPNGYPIQSPYVSIASKQAEIMIRIAVEFGFTPASRMRFPKRSKDSNPALLDIPSLEDFASDLKTLE
jgi:P27 family predicted phage terminase small subunit